MKDIVIRIRPDAAHAANFFFMRAALFSRLGRFAQFLTGTKIGAGEGRQIFPLRHKGKEIGQVFISFEDPPADGS